MNLSMLLRCTCSRGTVSRFSRRFLHERIWNSDCTVVTEALIKDKLTSLSVPFTDGYACLLVKNCFCQKTETLHGRPDCFINKRTGLFLCEQCKITCDWNVYRDLLEKSKDKPFDVRTITENWQRYDKGFTNWDSIVASTTPLKSLKEENYKKVFIDFGLQFCSKLIADRLKIRISSERDILYFPLFCLDSSVVGYKTYYKDKTENTYPNIDCPGLLSYSTHPRETTIVVANIPDFLALISQNLHEYDIICLQYGASYLPQTALPFFERYKKIILWLGNKSLDATGNLSRKLNEKRCYVVRPMGNQVSASAALSKNENFRTILENAKLTWHQFVTTFSSFREEILAQLQNVDEVSGVPWKRFPKLTKILKGHRRGEVTILTGPTGVGKTTFLSEYSLDLAMQGVNTLWGSFEIKNSKLARILLTQFAKAPLTPDPGAYNSLCDEFERLPIFFLSFHGQQDMRNVMDAVTHCSYIYDIAHVVIDNIQFMIEVSPDVSHLDRFWKQDFMIQSFRTFATKNNCHVTLVMHPKKIEGIDLSVNSIFGGVKASQEADNILIIQKKEYESFGVKKYLQICKNRYDGELGSLPLFFDKPSLCFSKTSPPDSKPWQKSQTVVEDQEEEDEQEEQEKLHS